jgi:hypothetical protein
MRCRGPLDPAAAETGKANNGTERFLAGSNVCFLNSLGRKQPQDIRHEIRGSQRTRSVIVLP